MPILRMTDLDLRGKRVLIREDLNVPVQDGFVTSDARIRASLPTIQHARNAGARVLVMSHLGRPEEGVYACGECRYPQIYRGGLENLPRPDRPVRQLSHGV